MLTIAYWLVLTNITGAYWLLLTNITGAYWLVLTNITGAHWLLLTNQSLLVTEVMAVGASSRLSLVDSNSAEVGVGNISFKTSVKYLGVKTGQPLFMQDPIISVCRASSVELRSLASIRPYLSNSTYARLVTALITSRLVIATQCWLVCLWNRQVDCRGVRTVQHGLFFFVSGIT